MLTTSVTMRQVGESLGLHLQAGVSYNKVGPALKVSKSAGGKYVPLARLAGARFAGLRAHARVHAPTLARELIAQLVNLLVGFVLTVGVFAMIYKIMSRVQVQ